MLTVKQSGPYGLRPVHDLPTPPSTSRPSPTVIFQDYKPLPAIPRSHSPSSQLMSAPPRGLPPPAAMIPPQPPPPSSGPPPPAPSSMPQDLRQQHAPAQPHPSHQGHSSHSGHSGHPSQSHASHPSQSHHGQGFAQLPPPPPQWHGAEESYRSWLNAKAEEERRKQEEEKTQQETLKLEQRKQDYSILERALTGGVPPTLVPLVFVAIGGHSWSPAMAEWAQQTMMQHTQPHRPPQLMPAPGPVSPDRRRDSQGQPHGQYSAVPSTPGGSQAPGGAYQFGPTSPRMRGHTVSGPSAIPRHHASGANLPSLNTNVPPHQGSISHAQSSVHQQESQASPIFFHYWQPPATEGDGGSNQPATPSGSSKTKRKRDSPRLT
jgi:hypothetical protein